jgi:hypothetical protein
MTSADVAEKPLFDPKVDGRGIWHIYNIKAIQATTDVLKVRFFEEMTWLSLNYPCEKCRNHMQGYIKDNPFNRYTDVSWNGKDIGCFKWIHGLHNSVNKKLNKPIMSFESAYNIFDPTNIKPCESGCHDDTDDTKEAAPAAIVIAKKEPLVRVAETKSRLVPIHRKK